MQPLVLFISPVCQSYTYNCFSSLVPVFPFNKYVLDIEYKISLCTDWRAALSGPHPNKKLRLAQRWQQRDVINIFSGSNTTFSHDQENWSGEAGECGEMPVFWNTERDIFKGLFPLQPFLAQSLERKSQGRKGPEIFKNNKIVQTDWYVRVLATCKSRL